MDEYETSYSRYCINFHRDIIDSGKFNFEMRKRGRERVSVCVCVCERERESEVGVYLCAASFEGK